MVVIVSQEDSSFLTGPLLDDETLLMSKRGIQLADDLLAISVTTTEGLGEAHLTCHA